MKKVMQQDETRILKRKRKHRAKIMAIGLLLIFFFICIVLIGYMGKILVSNYQIDETRLEMKQLSTVYDQDGEQVSRLYIENRQYVPIDDIPEIVQQAFVAVEDQRFFQHGGIDLRAIARALYRDIVARSLVEGGSTITQQLAKNVFLTHEKKLMRKTEEVLIAVNLENRYSKEEILEMYLNYIYFGHGAYGIQSASQLYFEKDVQELELEEIALLAAMPKAPYHYTPFRESNEERSENRRRVVLRLMEEQGFISSNERELAVNSTLQINANQMNVTTDDPSLQTYIDMVLDEAKEKYGISTEQIMSGGFNIYTTLDTKAQQVMYQAFHHESEHGNQLFPSSGPDHIVQGSMVIIDHTTGGITAVIGGRDYVRRGTNRAISKARQPGSTFKPFVSYAPALEQGWSLFDMVQDRSLSYNGYQPRNINNVYRGEVTMNEALQQSYNAPAVWLLNELGMRQGVEYAKSFGFEQVDFNLGLGVALGGGEFGTSPVQMASAYGTFANDGIRVEPYLIEAIIDQQGNVIVENILEEHRVVSPHTAWHMTQMLINVVKEGTGKRAQFAHPVAGKTGTTQTPNGQQGVRDAWFVGYTPQYTAAVWMGFDYLDSSHIMESSGGNHPALVFKFVMEQVLADRPVENFIKPEGVEEFKAPKPKMKENKKNNNKEKNKDAKKDKKKDSKQKKEKKNERKGPPAQHPGRGRGLGN